MASTFARLPWRRLLLIGVPVVLALGVFVLLFFQPQKLFIDDRVDEEPVGAKPTTGATAGPAAGGATDPTNSGQATPAGSAPVPPPPPPAPVEIARAAFRSLEHTTSGQAIVTELPDGSRVLRFEGFETSNGPDLRVYLSAGSSDAAFGKEYGEDYVELGRLKGNLGNQNYTIPAGTDLSRYRNAVVWCKRFGVGFGVATLG